MIHRSQQCMVVLRHGLVLYLLGGCRNMRLASGCFFCRRRPRDDSARAAVVSNPIHGNVVVNYRGVVDVAHIGHVHIVDILVVVELPTAPIPTRVAGAGITESVVNAAIETDSRTPIAGMPTINAGGKTPVAGRPKQPWLRR